MPKEKYSLIPSENIASRILLLRNQKVLIDADLSALYGTTTKRLNEQVKRNIERFPKDFMFQLTNPEKEEVVANCDHLSKLKFSKINPNAFTEYGAIMAASILNTPRAIEMSVLVVRTFVKLRQMISTHKELSHKLIELEQRVDGQDETLQALVSAIRQLMEPSPPKKKYPIGFAEWPKDR